MRTSYPVLTGDPRLDRILRENHDNTIELANLSRKVQSDLSTQVSDLQDQINMLIAAQTPTSTPPTGKGGKSALALMRPGATGGGGSSIQNMLGVAAQPQLAGVPYFQTKPPNTDPSAQDGALVLVGNTPSTATLFRWDATTQDPPVLVPVAPGGGGGGTITTFINPNSTTANANTTQIQLLSSVFITAGELASVGKVAHINAFGTFTMHVTSVVEFQLFMGPDPMPSPPVGSDFALTQFTIFSAIPNGTFGTWSIDMYLTVRVAGFSATMVLYGNLWLTLGSVAGTVSTFTSFQSGGGLDLTAAQDIAASVQFATQPGSAPFNIGTCENLVVEVLD